jgi:NADH dehydrogenase/putative oxidoreductase
MRTISDGTSALAHLTHKGLPKLSSANARLFRIVRATAWPILDAGTRSWLAQVFFVSGVLKVTHWQTALNPAANEYPVNWMDPVSKRH